ncbi:DUF1284 domain-containing protein [Dictyoglomus thermophilum]|uniref:DUF1284 domain-containing protein n=1 Tax=Dictyoglomus thermophilum TaxID=14 RepID=A0A7C2CPG1_DICTH|nr:DUF1284 domain-containing protein [Dictyoglomus thermophilum]TYT22804.1 DUF1284 domain-containing protein [Dictyoglomus thermophilum]
MKIRGRHLFCLLHFEGKGYSQDFIENMYKIKESLENRGKFSLVLYCDDICKKCPYMENNKCRKDVDNKLMYKDNEIVSRLGLSLEGELYDFAYVKALIFRNFNRKDFEDLCKDCSWFSLCSERGVFR